MKTRAEKHLATLCQRDEAHWLQAALVAYQTDPQDLDLRITLVGAMQQSGWGERQIRPYLTDWDVDARSWIRRGMERLLATFHGDPLATSALLYFSAEDVLESAREFFPHLVHAQGNDGGGPQMSVTRAQEWNRVGTEGNFANRCLKIRWTPGSRTMDASHYAKVISGAGPKPLLFGRCCFSSWSCAVLPSYHYYTKGEDVELGRYEAAESSVRALPAWAR